MIESRASWRRLVRRPPVLDVSTVDVQPFRWSAVSLPTTRRAIRRRTFRLGTHGNQLFTE